jgi:hypothetical protein
MNALYSRVIPGDAVELVAAYLTDNTDALLTNYPRRATLQQRQRLATVIHLCGAGAAAQYVRQGLRTSPGEHCGDQDVAAYLGRVQAMTRLFDRLRAQDPIRSELSSQ